MRLALVAVFSAAALFAAPAPADKEPVTVDAVVSAPSLQHGSVAWAPDGARFLVDERGALSVYDVRSGRSRDVVELSRLDAAAVAPSEPTAYQWTDRRVGEHPVQWFADGKRLLVAANGDLFIVDVNSRSFEPLTHTPEFERDPKLSPDNRRVSFRRGPDLYTVDVASKAVKRLTTSGSDTLLNGELDWVYPEELELGTAHWWSPDSRFVAYLQFDVAREPQFPQVDLLRPNAVLQPERYPQPGDPNADVHLGVVPAEGGPTKWMDLGETRGHLFARVVWAPSGREIMVERLNRVQNRLDLLMADIGTGASRVVLHEEDPYWINIKSEPQFIGEGDRFLWNSERSGFRHLYLYGVDGRLIRQLTSGDWEVDEIAPVDQRHNRVFFTSTEASPLERHIYSASLDGADKKRLSETPGTHAISLAPGGDYYIDDFSSLTVPPRSTIHRTDGTQEREFRQSDRNVTSRYEILPTEIVTLPASDGTPLYARLIKPPRFEPGKKHPAVVTVYGGPGVQSVRNAWPGLSWEQVLAQNGFVIWQLDNRGSSGRGHKFEIPIYHNMGTVELEDQKTGIDYLVKQGLVDPARIGLYGWSYGGYMTLFTVTGAPGLIRAAVSGAPVTNWLNYDSIYTERYMGLPEEDPQGYRISGPMNRAADLAGTKLLIVHNIEDDNVHFQNAIQMADALEKAGKQFRMLVYPQKSHHVSGPENRQLLGEITAFFEESLK